MNYQTIFDLQSAGYRNWWFPAFGLVFMLILAIVRKVKQRPMMPPKFITGFCIIWIVGTAAGTYLPHRKLLAAYSSGNYETVEGVVDQFAPLQPLRHGMERFCVKSAQSGYSNCFEYSDNVLTPGFHSGFGANGPIRVGTNVRVLHVGNDIIRLEIAPGT